VERATKEQRIKTRDKKKTEEEKREESVQSSHLKLYPLSAAYMYGSHTIYFLI
jgi:hypothetical protein